MNVRDLHASLARSLETKAVLLVSLSLAKHSHSRRFLFSGVPVSVFLERMNDDSI